MTWTTVFYLLLLASENIPESTRAFNRYFLPNGYQKPPSLFMVFYGETGNDEILSSDEYLSTAP